MLSLPTEIVGYIFDLVRHLVEPPLNFPQVYPYSTKPIISALKLANVDRRWRDIALSTPALWSQVAIGPRTSPDLLTLLFGRSKTYLLEIMIDAGNGILPSTLMAMCVGVASRCRLLAIQFSDPDIFSSLFNQLASPSLEAISIQTFGMVAVSLYYKLSAQKAPSLNSIYTGGGIDIETIDCARVTTLYLACSGEELFQIIAACPNLQLASFYVEGGALADTCPLVLAPHLEELHLQFGEDGTWVMLTKTIQHISAPVLELLNISPSSQSRDFQPADFISTISTNPPLGLFSVNSVIFDFPLSPQNHDVYSEATAMLRAVYNFIGLRILGVKNLSVHSLRLAFQAHPLVVPRVNTLILCQSGQNTNSDWTSQDSPDEIAIILDLRRQNASVADFTTLALDGDSRSHFEEIKIRTESSGCRVVSTNTHSYPT